MSALKRKAWFKLIEEWEAGSQSQPLFCKEKNISQTTFGYYRSEYLRAALM